MEVYLPVRERRTDIQEIGFLAQNQFQFRGTLEGIDQHLSLGVPGHDKLKIVAELLWKAAAKRMVGWDGLGKVELGMGGKILSNSVFWEVIHAWIFFPDFLG